MGIKEEEYKQSFGLGSPIDRKKAEQALQHALDIRKFEIGLYWQRATYFWALIAATFAGFFAVLASEHMVEREFNAFVLACIGLIFSIAWFLTNRGSKFWQENWENHVDMLEDDATGPLYKTVLRRPKEGNLISRAIEGPAPYSVSQINQWVSLFTVAVWLCLIWLVLPPFAWKVGGIYTKHAVIGTVTLVAALLLLFRTRSNITGGYKHSMAVNRTAVIDE